ncbi:ATP-dependent helicase [Azohydromonas sediminis]|uniref:ATP-dependent helicase n=1 Tax=Azohydromonas sediminis TaxID=2259674 RepID=UPI000E65965D|nr:ATP-dependent helicase [Azohydromonas sediminis]
MAAVLDRRDPFAVLNAEQLAAAEHGVGDASAPALLVVSGAGTGKTATLAARVAKLVLAGADPQRVLLLTFSRRAAHEMAQRAARLLHAALGLPPTLAAPQLPWAGTFHAVAARLLREHAPRIGLAPAFTIVDRGDAEDLMGLVRHEQGLAASARRFPLKGTCLAIHSRAVNTREPVEAVVRDAFPWCLGWEDELRRLFAAYVAEKQRQQLLDYDDLLLYWQLLLDEPSLAGAVRARFDHVLVDEYQDTNRLQAAIVRGLKPDGRGLTVVGDDAQAIYGFRGAEVRHILDLPRQFEPPARVVTLTRNYRSTQPLLAAANAVVALAPEGFAKSLWSDRDGERPRLVAVADEAAQARWVADEVLRRREEGLALKQQAVLFRAAQHGAALELELARRDIPFVKYGGLAFLEAAHVKDLLSVLRWVHNPRHRLAGLRVAQLVPGIGPAHARRLVDAMAQSGDPVQAMHDFDAPRAAATDWAAWLAAAAALRTGDWPGDVACALQWYRPHLERLHDDAAVRLADLEQLARLAAGYPSRERFLAELTLDPPQATSDEAGAPHRDEDWLVLSTIHAAKGQEWAAVCVLHAVDGCIPSDLATGSAAEIEEERRLLYVAMTRAKRHLALLVPQRFHVTAQHRLGDRHVWASLTRFVPPSVAALFDVETAVTDAAAAEGVAACAGAAVDLAARARAAF